MAAINICSDFGAPKNYHQFSRVQLLSYVQLFATPWIAARQASLSITNSQSLLKVMSIESVMPSAISSSVVPFSSWPQSLPASGSFPMSQLFAWGAQSIGVSASASVLPMNTQDWSPLEWTAPVTSWQINGETVEIVTDFILGGLQNHCRCWLQSWN